MNFVLPLLLGGTLLALPTFVLAVIMLRTDLNEGVRRLVSTPAGTMVMTLLVSAGLCIAIQSFFLFSTDGQGSFASFGAMKKITLPLVYLLFGVGLILQVCARSNSRTPIWIPLLLGSLMSSSVLGFAVPRQAFSLSDWLQGALLLGGFVLFALVGSYGGGMTTVHMKTIATVFAVITVMEAITNESVGVFISIGYAVTTAGLYLGIRKRNWLWGISSAGLAAFMSLRLFSDIFASSAVKGQLAVSFGLIALCLMPRVVRLVTSAVAVIIFPVTFMRSEVLGLMQGHYEGITDVTLSHRGYETHQVLDLMQAHPVTYWFGLGPSGTVSLAASPDFSTLYHSGRYLPAVDDVHLLTSWVLLKLGVIGLFVTGVVVAAGLREVLWVLSCDRPESFDVLLVNLFLAGLVMSLPAATMLFATPLPALSIGLLHARRHEREGKARHSCSLHTDPEVASSNSVPAAPRA